MQARTITPIFVIFFLLRGLNAFAQADVRLLDLLNLDNDITSEETEEISRENTPFFDFIGDDESTSTDSTRSVAHDSLKFIPRGRLPMVAFIPVIFDRVDFLAPPAITDPANILAQDNPSTDWLHIVSESNRRYRELKQWYMMRYPERVKYNFKSLPEPPKTYNATVDPSTQQITINEVIVNVDSTQLKSGVTTVDFGQRHWLHTFAASAQFSQAYISPNWYQGGDGNINAIGNVVWTVKLNPKFHSKLIAEATTQYKLATASAPQDTVHNYIISEDLFQFNGTLGLKAVNNWYYSLTGTFKTQFLKNFKGNSHEMKAAFLSPGELNLGLGMTYNLKDQARRLSLDVSVAPLSYNLKVSTNRGINVTNFGIKEGHRSISEIGSSAEVKLNWDIMWNINYTSRLFLFTDYDYIQGDWQNTVNFSINRYLSTQIFVHIRYDSSVPKSEDSRGWHRWQLKEILSFGLQYQFKTI